MLRVSDIDTSYGTSQVLFGVSLDVDDGQAVALLGRNGMGKSTTIKTIVGSLRPGRGSVTFDGASIGTKREYEICRLGFGYVPEGRRIFRNVTVEEQLTAFARQRSTARRWSLRDVYDLFPGLAARRESPGGLLSGGEQQMLAIGRALMTSPRIVVLDEATEGLAPVVRERIWAVLAELKRQKLSILIVDKNVDDVMSLVDAVYILEKGRVAWSGTAAELAPDLATQQRLLAI
jgi:branched-chain amino acid transport system ATP-binding protein